MLRLSYFSKMSNPWKISLFSSKTLWNTFFFQIVRLLRSSNQCWICKIIILFFFAAVLEISHVLWSIFFKTISVFLDNWMEIRLEHTIYWPEKMWFLYLRLIENFIWLNCRYIGYYKEERYVQYSSLWNYYVKLFEDSIC